MRSSRSANDMSVAVARLVEYYETVFEERWRGLPIVNSELDVEAVGFRELEEHELGVLITPWFINLVVLPGSDRWRERPQGSVCKIRMPGAEVDFTVSHNDELGTTLSAALFGTVTAFPDQATAREVAIEVLRLLFDTSPPDTDADTPEITRRQLFAKLGG